MTTYKLGAKTIKRSNKWAGVSVVSFDAYGFHWEQNGLADARRHDERAVMEWLENTMQGAHNTRAHNPYQLGRPIDRTNAEPIQSAAVIHLFDPHGG